MRHVPDVDVTLEQRRHVVLGDTMEGALSDDAEDTDFVLAVAGVGEV